MNGVFWIIRTRVLWRNLPPDYVKWYMVRKKFIRWARNGMWEYLFEILSKNTKLEKHMVMIDSRQVKVHVRATGAKNSNQGIGYTKERPNPKVQEQKQTVKLHLL